MFDVSQLSDAEVLAKLATDDADTARRMCFEAGERGLTTALPVLVKHIQSDNLGVQEAAEFALRSIKGEATVNAVIPLLRLESPSIRNAAMDILREIGSDNVLALTKLLSDADVDIRIFATDILGSTKSPLAMSALCESLLSDEDVNVRYQAATSLGVLGFVGAAQSLQLALKDEEWVQFAAIDALASIRDDSCIDMLIDDLDVVSPLVASTIINALGEMGNIKAAPVLLSRLEALSEPLRNKAVKAIIQMLGVSSLGYLGADELKRFHLYLIDALEDTDEDIVKAALAGLAVLASEEGAEAVLRYAKTLNALTDTDKIFAVVECLSSIGYVNALVTGLASKHPVVVGCCVDACGNIGDKLSTKALCKAFWGMDCGQQRIASDQLLHIADETFVPVAMEILDRHSDSQVIMNVLRFLGTKVHAVEVAPTLIAYIEHPVDGVKEAALEACLALQDPTINKRLVALANSTDPVKRLMGTYSMGQIDTIQYFGELTKALSDLLGNVRQTALQALVLTSDEKPECLDLIVSCLQDEDRDVRRVATESLQRFASHKVSDHLFKALEDADPWVRIRAVEVLEGFKLPEAIPFLVKGLASDEVLVMLKIVKALGVIGGDVAFHALLALSSYEDQDVAQAVAAALEYMRAEKGETF